MTLNSVAQAILRLCKDARVHLLPQFVPGHLNVLAYSLSRGSQVLGSEWTLCMDVCLELFRHWPVTVDLFATSLNHRLQVYFSPMADRQAAGNDTMLQSWEHLQAYAFPPFGFIQRVFTKVHQSRNFEVTLVALFWPLKPWIPDLLELLVGVPVLLPQRRDLLRQPHSHHFHQNLRALDLTGYRIASDPSSTSASLRLNYQSKWNTYRAWCHSHGHAMSWPFVPKVADFLLYLCRSLHLSYSSIASYRSMLSAAFRFVLPELSSHPVLHDLLRSFRLERPFLPRSFLLGIFSGFSLFFGVLLSSLSPLVLSGISLVRSSSFFLWLWPAV